ncbi:MAG: AMP-binding protein [Bradymonadaceae bacterium]
MADKKNGTNGTNGTHGTNGALAALPASAADEIERSWSVSETLRGRRILITGTTGFLGKVTASMLLKYHADIDQLYVMIRARRDQTAEERFYEDVATSGALDPIRDTYGAAYFDFLREKVTVLSGDVTDEHLGLDEEEAKAISSRLDVFIHSAGLTNFNPNLSNALEINALAMRKILDFIRLGGSRASLQSISTTFVAGCATRPAPEILPGPTVYPKYDELQLEYDAEREIEDCLNLIQHTERLSHDQEHHSRFVQEAREWCKKHNFDPNDAKNLDSAIETARKRWVDKRLSQEGRERAAFWGWPNIYTYTKSLGERLLAQASDEINLSIVRPAVIESSVSFPQVGWNEGINTTAPLAYLIYKGHRFIPTREGINLDVIPVDYVSGAMLAVAAALINHRHHDVYHLGSSDLNPVSVSRLVELSTLGSRKLIDRETKTPGWKKLVMKSMDSRTVERKTFERRSAPGIKRALTGFKGMLDQLPTRQLGGVGKAIDAVKSNVKAAESIVHTTEKIFELFMPFIYDNKLTFLARNIGELVVDLPESERLRYGSPIQDLDWRVYWLEVHLPGLARHSFPELDAKLKASSKTVYTYDDLVELFDASAHNFSNRIAFQHHDKGIVERFTYGEVKERAERASGVLAGIGAASGSAVLLAGENRPQWGMAYFGILKTGAIAVPVDSTSTVDQFVNVARSCRARIIVVSELVAERIQTELEEALSGADFPVRIVTFAQLFTLALPDETTLSEAGRAAATTPTVDSDPIAATLVRTTEEGTPLASLIYTSGTTGNPKGVMLTHKNFTSLLASLQQTFRINERDGFLSVLPLHHTFEFTAGFLMPLSKGATVTYLEELSGEELSSALSSTRVTALIGVPALWQLLNRRIDQRLSEAPPTVQWLVENLISLNTALRERMGINAGQLLFGAIHRGFGGKIRYLISGGAALPNNTLEAFYGMGFDLYEGYGLTEAAPVLTVNRPDKGLTPGTVGKALPGIEVDIKNPNDEGVGEIIARGPNVMLGYLGRDEDTARALKDGWLYTGDLGKFDKKGNLIIVGREKELIVTSGGKNVYPDELEDLYGKCPHVLELSVVGLPDGSGSERVACLVRPELPENPGPEKIAELRATIREWIRVEGSRVPSHDRIQALRFWDEEFPRTATKKIKRNEVVGILERLIASEVEAVDAGQVEDTTWGWLDATLGRLTDVDPSRIHNGTHFLDDLGFDSLMVVELASILETRGYHVTPDRLTVLQTVGQLQDFLAGGTSTSTALVKAPVTSLQKVNELPVHPTVAKMTMNALYSAQMRAYGKFFDVEVYGRAHIPFHNPNIVVVANHSSHLDMGLVKYALGEFGSQIRALAAADYFFSNTARKTYFKNFTNLIPVTRSGTMESSLGAATDALKRGEMLLMFPEGTRSPDGKLKPFRRGLGYLVDSQKVDILPIYIEGTHRALPKGKSLPSLTSRKLKVHIGKPISAFDLQKEVADLGPTERYELIGQRAHKAVETLRDAAQGTSKNGPALEPIFDSLNTKFERHQVDSPVSFYFSLGNVDGYKWTVNVAPETCLIHPGKPRGTADCVIKTSPEIFRKIVEESYVPSLDEFMSGAIKTNDPDLLMRFQAVFRL